jgi:hypothetical protein
MIQLLCNINDTFKSHLGIAHAVLYDVTDRAECIRSMKMNMLNEMTNVLLSCITPLLL